MDEVLAWIGTHWIEWLFCLVGAGLVFFAKHHVKTYKTLMEEKWKDKEKNMCGKIITTFEEKINEVEENSSQEDKNIKEELTNLREEMQ